MKKSTMSIAIAVALLGMSAAQASEFDGLYIGGKLGINNSNITGTPSAASKNATTIGFEEGYNWDMGNFLLGADFFVDMNQKATHVMTPVGTQGSYGSASMGLDLKLGLPTGNWMPYAKVGWDRTTGTVVYTNAAFKYTNHLHLGLGVEYKFAPNWSVTGEYTRTGSKATSATLTNDNVTVGLNYYFGSAPEAVAVAAAAPVVIAPVVQRQVVAPVVAPVVTPAPVVKKEEVKMRTIFTDKPVTIEGANFDTGSAKLKPAAASKVAPVVDFAKQNPEAQFTVTGFTDSVGSAKLNKKLSAKRANSVKALLVKKGVDAKRITATGKGMENPIGDNKTKAGRAANRRVEINYIDKEAKQVRAK